MWSFFKMWKQPKAPAKPVKPLSPRESFYAELKKPEIQANLLQSAINIEKRFNGNWFTFEQLCKKMIKQPLQAKQLMNMLEVCGYAKLEKQNEVLKYKISINPAQRLAIFETQLKSINLQRDNILGKMEELRTQLDTSVKETAGTK